MPPPTPARKAIKSIVGRSVATLLPQCRYDRCIFVLAHMRCGSTALSNVLCSRPDVSGYGEAKIHHTSVASLGQLVVNQARRQAWKPKATYLFDKILHTRHDGSAPHAFYSARAIFLARRPGPTIRSIDALYRLEGRTEYPDHTAAAGYYIGRIDALIEMWHRFPQDRRVGLTHASLLADPDAALARISRALTIDPPLVNHYVSLEASRTKGGGDPTASGRHSKVVARADDPARDAAVELDISPALREQVEAAYQRYTETLIAD